MEKVIELLRSIPSKYYLPLGVGCIGLILLVYGFGVMLSIGQPREKMGFQEFSQASSSAVLGSKQTTLIAIDIEGAVASPSVVTVANDARVQDAIIAAGGFSKDVDKDWISKHLNLAAKLTDGAKIYIPKIGESPQGNFSDSEGLVQDSSKQININSATESELDSLPGVGPVTAQKIISGRPYTSIEDLTTRKVVNAGVYAKIKDSIVAY